MASLMKDFLRQKLEGDEDDGVSPDSDRSPYESVAREGAELNEDPDDASLSLDDPVSLDSLPPQPMPPQAKGGGSSGGVMPAMSPDAADPMMKEYLMRQRQADERRQGSDRANLFANVGQAASHAALGVNTPQSMDGFYANLAAQNQHSQARDDADMNRQASVIKAMQLSKAKQAMASAASSARAAQMADMQKWRETQAARTQGNSDRDFSLRQNELGERRQERADAAEERAGKATGDQFKAGGFGRRLEQAEAIFDKISKAGYDRTSAASGIQSMLPTSMQTSDSQQQEQAERNFVNAVLRRESGAAISPAEFSSAEKQYFPRTGDSTDVLANKKANRLQVAETLKAEAGPGWDKIPDVSPKSPGESYPKTVKNAAGATATVSSAQEAKEAAQEGFH